MELIFVNGEKQGERCILTPPGVSIGRETDNDLQVLVKGVSRYHAMVSFDGRDWYIEDLGSTNGTYIGQNRISAKEKLSPGDVIAIGDQKFSFNNEAAVPPVAVTTVVENQPEQSEQPEQGDLASEIRKSKFSIFSGQKNSSKGPGDKKKSKFGNIIFTLLIVTLPLVCISGYMVFVKVNEKKENSGKSEAVVHPFALQYKKIIVHKDNIFRFEAKIEDDMVSFTVDDLKYNRHFQKIEVLEKEKIESLKSEIKKTEFQKLTNDDTNATVDSIEKSIRRIDLALDGNYNSITVKTRYGKKSFEDIEEAISNLAQFYSIQTGILTAEQIRDIAKNDYLNAKKYHSNYLAKTENIRLAIDKYKAALSYYEQFEPKPREWVDCQKGLDEAEKIYKEKRKELVFNIQKYNKTNQPDQASKYCSEMLQLLAPGSDDYKKFREYKMGFDRKADAMKKNKKRKKK